MERKREACKSDESVCPLEAAGSQQPRGSALQIVCPGAAEPLTFSVLPGRRQAFPCGGFGTQWKVWMATWKVWNVWAFRSHEQQMFPVTWEWASVDRLEITNRCVASQDLSFWKLLLASKQQFYNTDSRTESNSRSNNKKRKTVSDAKWHTDGLRVDEHQVECQLHASKSRQPQKSCCLICVPLSPWQSETDNEEAPLLLLFCQKELEQSKSKAERRRWRCGELSQRHTHKHTRTQNCEFVI